MTAGAIPATPEEIDAVRIEAGYPVFGADLTDDTIPLEAGIEDRAISRTKGCYVGQEVIVRVIDRGHGRVARRLVGLKLTTAGVPARGEAIGAGGREVGRVTSAAHSPLLDTPMITLMMASFCLMVRAKTLRSFWWAALALGLRHGPIHAECRANERGIFVLEVAAPGLLVVKHRHGEQAGKFVNVAVLQGDDIKVVDERASSLPDCPPLLAAMLALTAAVPATAQSEVVSPSDTIRIDMNEGNLHARGHPGIQVMPLAWALAEEQRSTGRDLLAAFIVGYEVGARIKRASATRLAVHPHGTFGTIGAAVALARLLGYDPAATREIINVSATLGVAASRRALTTGATVRNIYTGLSGAMGWLAHTLVQSGFTGEPDAVASVYGAIYADRFDPEATVKGLGDEFCVCLRCAGFFFDQALRHFETT